MLRFFRFLLLFILGFFIVSLGFQWTFRVPTSLARTHSTALTPSMETFLGGEVLPLALQHTGKSGVAPLRQGQDAFAARMLLAEAAQHSIDARYYIWNNDATGLMLLDAMRRAADRGVRVRLLLDDNGTPNLDGELVELDLHPNIEVRLFNPFILRNPRMLTYLFDFARINRRMHNKSFTVDGVATVVGGRNVGDIYFAHNAGVNYFDLDVVALGPAAVETSQDFDLYWASPSAVPVGLILPAAGDTEGSLLEASVTAIEDTLGARQFATSVLSSDLMEHLRDGALGFEWADLHMVSDDPAKGQGRVAPEQLMINRLGQILGTPQQSVDLVSAYFVPGKRLTAMMSGWAEQGVTVRVLTNAQEATDVLPVHGGYLKYRDDLLDAGVQVFELKATQEDDENVDLRDQFGLIGSTQVSLHAKAFVIDQEDLFVGSFNFDPRSAHLNTEMGFLIRESDLARTIFPGYSGEMKVRAYQVRRRADGGTEWLETLASGDQRQFQIEPGSTVFSRFLVRLIGWLPVTWLL
ncbi:phospholipase D family protein [Parasedimentitalea maritima]|uniref:Phospholipase D n=1 Tax=Parasedimentitalea maritima TaxID=2578117 RepID=A0A6A4RND6_9RHOB|nr:phospholipase D family protein [Zongyanglinia marina]KAE9631541.1 phospholipase D family protein [Zongyanglinia marina]